MRTLEIHQPCDFDPSSGEPTGEAAATRCQGCGSTVHDLSAMTAGEATAFLDARKPGQCVTFVWGGDERIVFSDGPGSVIGRIAKDARPMVVVASLLLAACERGDRVEAKPEGVAPPTATASASALSAALSTASAAAGMDTERLCADAFVAPAATTTGAHPAHAKPQVPLMRLVGI
jgi:hypothetical protein